MVIEKVDPLVKATKKQQLKNKLNVESANQMESAKTVESAKPVESANQVKGQKGVLTNGLVTIPGNSRNLPNRLRYIPQAFRSKLWIRSKGRCEYVDPLTLKRCECCSLLEIDHIQPVTFGGSNDFENLRLICKTHNLYFATKALGADKMQSYISSLGQ
jgi:CRISPR/Cas system Type II protein with McrA/HNH and RuvC-like nuclease domain